MSENVDVMDANANANANANWMVSLIAYVRAVVGIGFVIPFTLFCSIAAVFAGALKLKRLGDGVVKFWSQAIIGFFGIRLSVIGDENIPREGGGVMVFNHQSHVDIPVIMQAATVPVYFGAKIELFKIPAFGAAMKAVGTLPIARANRNEVFRIYKEAAIRFKRNDVFVLAPEGTRQNEPKIGRFKRGPFVFAVDSGAPVVPVVIRGAYQTLPKGRVLVNLGRIIRTIEVIFLPAVSTKGLTHDDLDQLVERVRSDMVQAFEFGVGTGAKKQH